jgi:lysozyme
VPTIGYGATYYRSGTRVTLSDAAISKDEAEALLIWMINTVYLPAVIKLCGGINTPDRLAAIIDFTFNLGSGTLAASTLRKRINAGKWSDVPTQLLKWNKAAGIALLGLTHRRMAEGTLC